MSHFLPKIKLFVYGPRHEQWLPFLQLDVHMKKARRTVEGIAIDCIEIDDIRVYDQSQGVFTRFLTDVESIGYPIFVDNVWPEQFADFFRTRGYMVEEEYGMWTAFKFGKKVKWQWR